jgi:hypothetical protein
MPVWVWFVFCKILKFFAELKKEKQPFVAGSGQRFLNPSLVAFFLGFKPDCLFHLNRFPFVFKYRNSPGIKITIFV